MINFDDLGLTDRSDPRVGIMVTMLGRRIFREAEVADVLALASLSPARYRLAPAEDAWAEAVIDAANEGRLNSLVDAADGKAPAFRAELTRELAAIVDQSSRQAAIIGDRSATTDLTDWNSELEKILHGSDVSRSPIVVGLETTGSPLSGTDLAPVERHVTVTLEDGEVDRVVRLAREALVAPASVAGLIRSGQRIWKSLEIAQPRLASLASSLKGVGFAQPLAWCANPGLLHKLHLPLLLAHLGIDDLEGFVSIGRGSHYFNPVGRATRQPMRRRLGQGAARSRVVDLRSAPDQDELKLLSEAASFEVLIAVDTDDRPIRPEQVAKTIAGTPASPTRAAMIFTDRPVSGDELDDLMALVPFVSIAPRGLASDDLLEAAGYAMRRRSATWSLPSIVSALRAVMIRRAVASGDVGACMQALRWSCWGWVGLPLFAAEFPELVGPSFPHLMNLRSVSGEWYYRRHAGIPKEYRAEQLARSARGSDGWFHLYLSGAGGTGKSCFLRDVYQQARDRSATVAVWYRVDAPNSLWKNLESRIREKTIEAVGQKFGRDVANQLPSDIADLAPFLSQAAESLRRATDGGFAELLIFIDQLERTFEWGLDPDTGRLRDISSSLMALLDEFRDSRTVRVFIASRKQYLPDFLQSSRRANDAHLQFNVLQAISDQDEQRAFVRTIVEWSVQSELVPPDLTIERDAATMLATKVGGEPLSMALALMELLSSSELSGSVGTRQLERLEPWKRLFALDLEVAARNDLDWYFLLAMAHTRAEIVSLDEVLWRLRMVDSALTRQVDDLGRKGVMERLWLLGLLGRTIHARPQPGRSPELVEFFHANLRDYLLREVMAHGDSDLDLHRRGGTPAAWRALDQLTIYAHDWEQMQQLLAPEDTSALMDNRLVVTGQSGADEGDGPLSAEPGAEGLGRLRRLFQREPDDQVRERLSRAATECLIFSALVHDQQGRRVFEELVSDARLRAALCRRWLGRCAATQQRSIMRYFVELLSEEARRELIETVLDEDGARHEDLGQVLAGILAEPLYSARYRTEIIARLLISALKGRSDPETLRPDAISIVVASCRADVDTLTTLLGECVEHYLSSGSETDLALASRIDPRTLAAGWLAATVGLRQGVVSVDTRATARSPAMGLVLGDRVATLVTPARLSAWWHELSDRLGLAIPPLAVLRREVGSAHPIKRPDDGSLGVPRNTEQTSGWTADQIDLVCARGYLGSGQFIAGRVAVSKREWEGRGQPVPPGTPQRYLALVDEDLLWLTVEQCAAVDGSVRMRDVDDLVVDWLERHCRRYAADVLDEEWFAHITRELRPRMITLARLGLPSHKVKAVLTELVAEAVPIGSIQRVLGLSIELAPDTTEPVILVRKLRERYGAEICRSVSDEFGRASVIMLDQGSEQALADRVGADELEPSHRSIVGAKLRVLSEHIRRDLSAPPPIVVLVHPVVRPVLSLIMRDLDPRLPILSFTEAREGGLSPVLGGTVEVPELSARP